MRTDAWYEQLDVAAWNTMMGRVREGLPPTEGLTVDELNGTVLASVGDGKAAASDSEGVRGANGTQRQTFGETRTGIVAIKNGNGINGVGAEALERIKPLGYTADASNANSFSYEETVVVFDTPDQRVTELIDALGCGRAVQNTDGEYVYDGDFLILIGSDWQSWGFRPPSSSIMEGPGWSGALAVKESHAICFVEWIRHSRRAEEEFPGGVRRL